MCEDGRAQAKPACFLLDTNPVLSCGLGKGKQFNSTVFGSVKMAWFEQARVRLTEVFLSSGLFSPGMEPWLSPSRLGPAQSSTTQPPQELLLSPLPAHRFPSGGAGEG